AVKGRLALRRSRNRWRAAAVALATARARAAQDETHARVCPASRVLSCTMRPLAVCFANTLRPPAITLSAAQRDAVQCGGQVFLVMGSAAMRVAQAVSLGPSRSVGVVFLARVMSRCTSATCG